MRKLRKSKKEMRKLVIKMYNGLGGLLAILGFICISAAETTVKDFDGSLMSGIKISLIGLSILVIGAYMLTDGYKYEYE